MSNLTRIRREHPEMDGTPICADCGGLNDRGKSGYCRACHAAYMRRWRESRVYVKRETILPREKEDASCQ